MEEEEGPAARGTSTVTHAAKGDVPVLQTGAVDTTTTEATAAASVTCASLSTQPTPAVGEAAQTGNAIEAATTTDTPPAPTAVPPPRFITPGFFPTYLPGTTTTATTTTSSAAAPVTTFITPNHPFASPPDRASTAASIAPVPSVPYITTTAASSSTTDPRRSDGISAYDRRMAAAEQEALQWLPSYLKARIPLLLTTTLSLQEALTQCEGAASELPLELVRFCVLTGAERLLLPPTKESFSNAYWMSLCTAMDVECQFAFTADRMFEEVREFVEHTILPDSADDTIVLEQADQSIWAFLRPVIHSVTVEGTGREIAPPPGEDADGRPSRWQRHNSGGGGGGPRVTPEDIEVAKLTRTTHLIVDHFAQRARESAMKGEEKAQDGSGGGLGHSPWQGARVVVFTSTRREQTSVITRLQVLLREHPKERRAALLRLTTVSEHFSREQADVLVLCEAQLQDTRELRALGYCRQIGLLLHFSLPRNVMMGLPGDIADCLAARARAVLGPQRKLLFTRWLPTVMADAAAGNDAEAKERDVKVPTVLLLTEHNLNGKVGLTAMEALRPYGGDSLVMESMEGESERQ